MAFYNLFRASIIGRIGSVETINEGTDKEFSKMSVACNGFYTKNEERVEVTEWVDVLIPKKANLENFAVGRSVLVEGVPTVNAYVKDDKAVGKLRIVNARITFQDAKPVADGQETKTSAEAVKQAAEEGSDDLPF